MKSSEVTTQSVIEIQFPAVDPQGHKPPPSPKLEVEAIELDQASDALLIGFPDIVRWGIGFFDDVDGNVWVNFSRLGFMCLAEGPKGKDQ